MDGVGVVASADEVVEGVVASADEVVEEGGAGVVVDEVVLGIELVVDKVVLGIELVVDEVVGGADVDVIVGVVVGVGGQPAGGSGHPTFRAQAFPVLPLKS